MEWLDGLLGTAASAASGGVFGLLGSITGGVFKYFKAKQDHAFRKDEWQHELSLQQIQNERDRQEDEHELAVVAQQGSWSSLKESMQGMKAAGESYRWVNAVKDLYRPILTSGLFVLVYLIWRETTDAALREYIVYSAVFTASTAGVWWFGDRAFAPPGMKNR